MTTYEAVVVGAGIQGLIVAAECAERGRRVLVVDRAAAGDGTTGNSYGIVHGGLRYLQSLDVRRWRRSRRDQRWFLQTFPDLVEPLVCVMPLYTGTFRSPLAFRIAFQLERVLSLALGEPPHLPTGEILTKNAVAAKFGQIEHRKLVGAAQWHEVALKDPTALISRLKAQILRAGGDVAEGTEVVAFEQGASGIVAVARNDQGLVHLSAEKIILCAGPWSEKLTTLAGVTEPNLACEALAFNLLLDMRPDFSEGLAVSPIAGSGRSYFLRPYQGKLLAGTFYCKCSSADPERVGEQDVAAFMRELQQCLPGTDLSSTPVAQVLSGRLPTHNSKELASEDLIVDHGAHGGLDGVYTVLGVKLTTARSLALDAVEAAWPSTRPHRKLREPKLRVSVQ